MHAVMRNQYLKGKQMRYLQEFWTVTSPASIESGTEKKCLTVWIDFPGFDRGAPAISVTTTFFFSICSVQPCMTVWL